MILLNTLHPSVNSAPEPEHAPNIGCNSLQVTLFKLLPRLCNLLDCPVQSEDCNIIVILLGEGFLGGQLGLNAALPVRLGLFNKLLVLIILGWENCFGCTGMVARMRQQASALSILCETNAKHPSPTVWSTRCRLKLTNVTRSHTPASIRHCFACGLVHVHAAAAIQIEARHLKGVPIRHGDLPNTPAGTEATKGTASKAARLALRLEHFFDASAEQRQTTDRLAATGVLLALVPDRSWVVQLRAV